jgi:hypothetical protein
LGPIELVVGFGGTPCQSSENISRARRLGWQWIFPQVMHELYSKLVKAAFRPPHLNQSPNAHTRIEVSRLDIREVECRDPLWWLYSCVLRLHILTRSSAVPVGLPLYR